ncbi:MAG: T9SS type A sorting domain-containing protein [Bacteroidia bacterium]
MTKSTIPEIAYLNSLNGGLATKLARAILRLKIEDGPIGESRIKNPLPKKATRFFTVHPNPATDWLELNYSNEDQVKHLVIYDLSGRQIKVAGNTRTIKLIELQPGLYFISICYTDGEELIQKFIKQ